MATKTQQLQIRVSPGQKRSIRDQAERASQGLSEYVLSKVLNTGRTRFDSILAGLADASQHRFWLAEFNDLLAGLTPLEFQGALDTPDLAHLSEYLQNQVAAMVEHAAHQKSLCPPAWVGAIEPLEVPHFAVPLSSLREHLLTAAPVAFKRRNIFVDSSVGDRV